MSNASYFEDYRARTKNTLEEIILFWKCYFMCPRIHYQIPITINY